MGRPHVAVYEGLVGHYERRPLAGHLRGLGGGEGEVVFGDVEELGRVLGSRRIRHGGSSALVAVVGVSWSVT